MNITVLSVPDCPNVERVLDLLHEETVKRADVRIETSIVDTSQPMPAGFSGSPTILIDGKNFSGAPEISEPACTARLPLLAQIIAWIS